MKTVEELNREKAELLEEVKRKELEDEVKALRKKAGRQRLLEYVVGQAKEFWKTDEEKK